MAASSSACTTFVTLLLFSLGWAFRPCYRHEIHGSRFGGRGCPRRPRRFAFDSSTLLAVSSGDIEAVGATGRIGSLLLRQIPHAIAVPRGVVPGSLSSSNGSPILVATPSAAWNEIYDLTNSDRRQDLVWIGNGLLSSTSDIHVNATVVIPHFAALSKNGTSTSVLTSPQSPPTYVYGRYKKQVVRLLEKNLGVLNLEAVDSFPRMQQLAARKLLWASCLWLLCHSDTETPLTVTEVHVQRDNQLRDLVQELLPAFNELSGTSAESSPSVDEILSYMEQYSNSMPNAVPSIQLALSELKDRNGEFLRLEKREYPQVRHRALLYKVAGDAATDSACSRSTPEKPTTAKVSKKIYLDTLDLSCSCESVGTETSRPKSVAIVGSGILGSAIALAVIQQKQVQSVTVVGDSVLRNTTDTTSASWAWLNANQKQPQHYQLLNQLGMRTWRKDPNYSDLPVWSGSLLSTSAPIPPTGGYPFEGPLSTTKLKDLEPQANFSTDEGSVVYHFPQEGCVDPIVALRRIQKRARDRGVQFINGTCTNLVRHSNDRVTGIQYSANGVDSSVESDVVVVAAGLGTAKKELRCHIPMKHKHAGRLFFAKPRDEQRDVEPRRLKKVLVDTTRQVHVLQRSNGELVVGGGVLELGGGAGSSSGETGGESSNANSLLSVAADLVPASIDHSDFSHTAQAVRPIPIDGLPVAGSVPHDPNLYAVVSHSGFTLAPLLGMLVAFEVANNVRFHLLDPYRPDRLFANASIDDDEATPS